MLPTSKPLVRFYRLIEQARPPQPADRSACGTLPMRAVQYCEPVTRATSFGWWLFPPLDLLLMWDGTDIFWRTNTREDWAPLQDAAQFPHFAKVFDDAAPIELAGTSPPFLTALPEPGTLQLWTGLLIRTMPSWHLLIRSPVNLPCTGGFVMYEGIVETDTWFGPLFVNLRITRSHMPIRLRPAYPLVQVQPIHKSAYDTRTLNSYELIPNLEDLSSEDWCAYKNTVVIPNQDQDRSPGRYGVCVRQNARRSSCPNLESVMHSE